jgi:hypothetical protein
MVARSGCDRTHSYIHVLHVKELARSYMYLGVGQLTRTYMYMSVREQFISTCSGVKNVLVHVATYIIDISLCERKFNRSVVYSQAWRL